MIIIIQWTQNRCSANIKTDHKYSSFYVTLCQLFVGNDSTGINRCRNLSSFIEWLNKAAAGSKKGPSRSSRKKLGTTILRTLRRFQSLQVFLIQQFFFFLQSWKFAAHASFYNYWCWLHCLYLRCSLPQSVCVCVRVWADSTLSTCLLGASIFDPTPRTSGVPYWSTIQVLSLAPMSNLKVGSVKPSM